MNKEGFFALAEKQGVKLRDLTNRQFTEVCNALNVGYQNFILPPSIDEFIGYADKLEPTDDQKNLLKLTLEHNLTWKVTEGEEEESLKGVIEKAKAQIEEKESSLFPELI